jgi:hypothetical protein
MNEQSYLVCLLVFAIYLASPETFDQWCTSALLWLKTLYLDAVLLVNAWIIYRKLARDAAKMGISPQPFKYISIRKR